MEKTDPLDSLIGQLDGIRDSLERFESESQGYLSRVHPAWRKSAGNLLHYLALRHDDIRELQDELAARGLSSLGRSEAHVMSTLEGVLKNLRAVAGRPPAPAANGEWVSFDEGKALLAAHTGDLLAPAPAGRGVRIMVTLGCEAAEDYQLIRDLLACGMDCMRINCAHDTPAVWSRMIENLRRARRELGKGCRILMDVGGAKLRTGALEPGPAVAVWHPKRDGLGRVTEAAQVWLASDRAGQAMPAGADACLPVPAGWLATLRAGDRIEFRDARARRRTLEVTAPGAHGCWARCGRTAYVTTGTLMSRVPANGSGGLKAKIGALPPTDPGILLKRGDVLMLTRDPLAGGPARVDGSGRVTAPARIPCSMPEVFAQVREGEKIWFDDGKIGGIIRRARADALEVEITHARTKGSRLRADKGINLPDSKLNLAAFTTEDLDNLSFIASNADLVGMSFVRHERDIYELHRRLGELGAGNLGVVLKIETRQALERLPNLVLAAMGQYPAGIMIARGDLAVECGYERLAEVQEEILWICEAAHMPVIWATQVLETLAKTGQPSRAEITDAAMGERAECVMLNKGPHIVEAVKTLGDILGRMEDHQEKKSSRLRRLHLSAIRAADSDAAEPPR